jgi:hypothetical protein
MRRFRFESSAANQFLTASVSFAFWSILWWAADWFQKGSGLGWTTSLIIIAAVCLLHGYNGYRVGWPLGLAAVFPAFVIVLTQRNPASACWSVLVPFFVGWMIKAEELET